MTLLELDESYSLELKQSQPMAILELFSSVISFDAVHRIDSLLKNKGVTFDVNSCQMECDPGEEPFEGVKFSAYSSWDDYLEEVFVSEEDFYDTLRVVVEAHLHKRPEDEGKLRKIFRKNGIAFEDLK